MGGTIESRRIQKLDFERDQLVENPISRLPIRLERLIRSEFARAAIFFCLWGMIVDRAGTASAERPHDSPGAAVADSSASQVESLAMLIQIVDQLKTYVRTRDLASIHNEDIILGFALGELLARADLVAPDRVEHYKTDLIWFAQQVSALHRVADLNQQAQSESELHRVMKALKMVKTHFSEPVLSAALKRAVTFTCPMHRDVIGLETDLCPKCGMMLDQVVRILPGDPGISTRFPRGTARLRTNVGTVDRR